VGAALKLVPDSDVCGDGDGAADQFHACPSAAFFATLPESSVHAVPSRDVPVTRAVSPLETKNSVRPMLLELAASPMPMRFKVCCFTAA
jgi:hypothetical protein